MTGGVVKKTKKKYVQASHRRRRGWSPWALACDCWDGVRIFFAVARTCGRPRLRISSTCPGSIAHTTPLDSDGVWRSFCSCCKRPIQAELIRRPAAPAANPARGRYAYVVSLWGSSPAYCLGAMVLAKSLRLAGVNHDLVLLHTRELSAAVLKLLAQAGWSVREVECVYGSRALYSHSEPRFKAVFTKLHVLSLVEYEKVLLLDIDTLVLRNVDDLFQLPAPAAMARGPRHGYQHGDPIEGRFFFGGASHRISWSQQSGINAGVMLLAPNECELYQMMREIMDDRHPSHIKGNGPEQDYLSRFWADCWTHIGVEYNFQLHQLYYTFHPDAITNGERVPFLTDPPGAEMSIVHYSGALKPWSRYLDSEWIRDSFEEGSRAFLQAMFEGFPAYWLWVLRDPETWEHQAQKEGFALDMDGRIRRIDWEQYSNWNSDWWLQRWKKMQSQYGSWNANKEDASTDVEVPPPAGNSEYPLAEIVEPPEKMLQSAENLVKRSMQHWDDMYRALSDELGMVDLLGENSLAGRVSAACSNGVGDAMQLTEVLSEAIVGKHVEATQDATAAKIVDSAVNCSQVWIDRPLGKASALACQVPECAVILSFNCRALIDLRGIRAKGLHAAYLTAEGAEEIFSCQAIGNCDDGKFDTASVSRWAANAPSGSVAMVALVGASPDATAELLAVLSAVGFGVPAGLPPADSGAIAAVGLVGQETWPDTMLASDFALATMASKL